jgi:hypothetical protein
VPAARQHFVHLRQRHGPQPIPGGVEVYEFMVPGRPVSVHGKSRVLLRRWREEVKVAAIRNSPAIPPFTMPTVRLTIVFFCGGSMIDTDNIIKPIQDDPSGSSAFSCVSKKPAVWRICYDRRHDHREGSAASREV